MKMKPIAFSFTISIAISLIFLFITFWIFYEYAGSKESAKDALSTTGSYFGAVATLGAAIIAAYLVNNWKQQTRYNEQLKCLAEIINKRDQLRGAIQNLRNDENIFGYLNQFFKETDSEKKQFIQPSFEKIDQLIDEIRSKIFECEMYENYGDNKIFPLTGTGFDNFYNAITRIEILKDRISALPKIFSADQEIILSDSIVNIAFFCSSRLAWFYGIKYMDNEHINDNGIQELRIFLDEMLNDCKNYRNFLEKNN